MGNGVHTTYLSAPESMQKSNNSSSSSIADSIVESPLRFTEDNELVPCLFTEIPTPEADGVTYKCTLEEGVKFHDGSTLTATDVKYSFERMDPATSEDTPGTKRERAERVAVDASEAQTAERAKTGKKRASSYWAVSWGIFKRNKLGVFCLGVVLVLVLVAIFAPLLAPYDPDAQTLTNMSDVVDRFIRYCEVQSQSDPLGAGEVPSTQRQFDIANVIAGDLRELGAVDVEVDDHAYVTAHWPASEGCEDLPCLGFCGHIDTAWQIECGAVHPHVVHYEGGKLVMESLGAHRLDLDSLSHIVLEPGSPCLALVVGTFGEDLVDAGTGVLDRSLLASRAFSTPQGAARLEDIELPFIREALVARLREMERSAADGIYVVEVPLLDRMSSAVDARMSCRRWSSACPPSLLAPSGRRSA